MVTSLHVRKLDADIVMRLKRRAAENNRSMEAEHRAILTEVLQPEPDQSFEALSAALRAETADRKHTPSEVLVRMSRDEAR